MVIKTITQIGEILENTMGSDNVEIEIGSGNGHFIAEYSEKKENSFLIGIELKRKRCRKIIKKIEKRNSRNVEIIHGRGEDLLEHLPQGKIDVFHIYFPDPWPKAKHRKRRFFRKTSVDLLARCLKQGGKINFTTDFYDYALQVKVLLSLHDQFQLIPFSPPEEVFLSVYANKFKDINRKIHLISAIKTS